MISILRKKEEFKGKTWLYERFIHDFEFFERRTPNIEWWVLKDRKGIEGQVLDYFNSGEFSYILGDLIWLVAS